MYDHQPLEGVAVSTASNQSLPDITLGKFHLAFFCENPTGLTLKEILGVSLLGEYLFSVRVIDRDRLDFVGKVGVPSIVNGRIGLYSIGNLYACRTYHLPKCSKTRFV